MTRWTETGRVAEALRQANIETWDVREVSPNHDGVILTQALARGIWQQETGQIRCEGHCRNEPGAPQHMTWEELSTDQQETFTSDLAHFPDHFPDHFREAGRQAEYRPERDSLDDDDMFDGIALHDCRPSPPGLGRRRGPTAIKICNPGEET